MQIVPAVDIRAGKCVNLVQGDYDQETVFSDDPVAQARRWHELGGELIHIVDLDGARAGKVCAGEALGALGEACIPYEIGGGIRDLPMLQEVVQLGATRVILGTAALRDPVFLHMATEAFPDKIVVGIDARDGKVAVSGWEDQSETDAIVFARDVEEAGAIRIIYTDILSDGMMKGPNIEATRTVAESVGIPVTASGGVSTLDDIRALKSLEPAGVDEVIVGRALYLESFSLTEAISVTRESG